MDEFRQAIMESGMAPPEVIDPGVWHRFPGNGKCPSNRSGWCLMFEGGLGGCFGDWSSGLSETWKSKQNKPYSRTDRVAFARRAEAARKRAEIERRTRQADAATRATAIWKSAKLATCSHPYLNQKRIHPHGAKLHKDALTLPITDFAGNLSSLQFIGPNGRKRLLSGGCKRGRFIYVAGDMTDFHHIIICEGWATGCTLAEDSPAALVLVAIDAGNLKPVALATRRRWPYAELVIAGDDDRLTAGNPGATKVKAAAIASNALLALPQWSEDAPEHLTDFNDLAVWRAGGEV
jgi:putative DNA primase/helicase